jgi:hypothetical protein
MRANIEQRLTINLERVRSLVKAYQGTGPGRRPVTEVDLLRAAVVFLHATLEDALRSALEWKWPETCIELDGLGVVLGPRVDAKVSLELLATSRGRSIDDIIRASIAAHLQRESFNNPGDIKRSIRRMKVPETTLNPYVRSLASLMARRHQIVHRADRHDARGPGHHAAVSISHGTVTAWLDAVEGFCAAFVALL